MKVTHINATDIAGGAARAAYRIHRSLVEQGPDQGIESRMRVIHRLSDDPSVEGGPPRGWGRLQRAWKRRLHPRLQVLKQRGFRSGNPVLHSIAWPDTGLGRELERCDADLLHLHWLGDATLSIEEIGRLRHPLVWTLHDQWAICGAEHYTTPPASGEVASSDERYVQGYQPDNRPAHEAGPDLNRHTWQRKRRAWRQPITIVCPSHWMADCAHRSALMAGWPVTVIPHPIDLRRWAPVNRAEARALLGLPQDRRIVLFGAEGGARDLRKGADLLEEALQLLVSEADADAGNQQTVELLVFGQTSPAEPSPLAFPIRYAGRLHDDLSLRLHYAAADVFVIPSRQDNLPNTGLEAHACGTPVVAFRTGGLPDIVDDRVTGALAEPFDSASLAAAIRWVLEDPERRRQLGAAARARAERLWNPARIAGLYAAVYREAMESLRAAPPS
jgi:glycosyltransferase involved in cell wall biosynthesis